MSTLEALRQSIRQLLAPPPRDHEHDAFLHGHRLPGRLEEVVADGLRLDRDLAVRRGVGESVEKRTSSQKHMRSCKTFLEHPKVYKNSL